MTISWTSSRLEQTELWVGLGQRSVAERCLRYSARVARRRGLGCQACFLECQALRLVGESRRAMRLVDRARIDHPHDIWLRLARSQALLDHDQPYQALRMFDQDLPFEPEFIATRSESLLGCRLSDRALVLLEAGLDRHPSHTGLLLTYSWVCRKIGRPVEGLRRLEPRLAESPPDFRAFRLAGWLASEVGELKWALECFEQALELAPDDRLVRLLQADAEVRLERPVKALQQYDGLLEEEPGDVVAWLGRARALVQLDRRRAALRHYDKVVQFAPEAPHGHLARGLHLLQDGRVSEAYRALLEARERLPAPTPMGDPDGINQVDIHGIEFLCEVLAPAAAEEQHPADDPDA